jgi:hypothetical protein
MGGMICTFCLDDERRRSDVIRGIGMNCHKKMSTKKCVPLDVWYWPQIDERRLWIPRYDFGLGRFGSVIALCIFRWVFGLYFLITAIMLGNRWFFTYLTWCGYLMNMSYLLASAALGTTALVMRHKNLNGAKIEFKNSKSPIGYPDFLYFHAIRLIQQIFAISVSFEIVITVMYWSLLWPYRPADADALYLYDNVDIHGIGALIMVIELIIGDHRVSLHDRFSIGLLGAAIIYAIINAISSLVNAPVYPILTWRKSSDALLVIGVIAFVIVVFFLSSLLTWGLDVCSSRCFRANSKAPLSAHPPSNASASTDWLAETEEFTDADLAPYFIPCTSCARCTEGATGATAIVDDASSTGASKQEQNGSI